MLPLLETHNQIVRNLIKDPNHIHVPVLGLHYDEVDMQVMTANKYKQVKEIFKTKIISVVKASTAHHNCAWGQHQ